MDARTDYFMIGWMVEEMGPLPDKADRVWMDDWMNGWTDGQEKTASSVIRSPVK